MASLDRLRAVLLASLLGGVGIGCFNLLTKSDDLAGPPPISLADASTDAPRDGMLDGRTLPGLIGYWPVDEGTGLVARDTSGNGRDGLLQPGASWTSGLFGAAVVFDGVGGRVTATTSGFGETSFSVFAWVNSTDTRIVNSRVVGWSFGVNGGYVYLLFGKGHPCIEARDSKRTAWDTCHDAARPSIADGSWHHVGMIFDRASPPAILGRLYVDGVESRSNFVDNPGTFGEPATAAEFMFGAMNANSPTLALVGTIDDVQAYGRALSDAEVKALARRP